MKAVNITGIILLCLDNVTVRFVCCKQLCEEIRVGLDRVRVRVASGHGECWTASLFDAIDKTDNANQTTIIAV